MKLQIEIHDKEGLKDTDIMRLNCFLNDLDYEDIVGILEGNEIGLGGDNFLSFKRV